MWDFWHQNSVETTITSQLHKIRISEIPHIQKGLEYIDTVTKVKQQNRDYYQNIHRTVQVTFKSLHLKYCNQNPNFPVSWGTFSSLKPFYVEHTSQKDIEMCCCKIHLHGRWAIAAIIECANDYQQLSKFL